MVSSWQKTMDPSTLDFYKFMTILGYGFNAVIWYSLAYIFSTREKAFYLFLVHVVEGVIN